MVLPRPACKFSIFRAINCSVPWGTEAIPMVRSSRPNGSEQNERWGRFGPTLFGVGVHQPRRGAPDRCMYELVVVLGNLNARVGNEVIERIVGQYGVPGRNESGKQLLVCREGDSGWKDCSDLFCINTCG